VCPIEPLHSLENGLIPDYLIILFKEEMRPTLKAELDSLVRRLTFLLPLQGFANSGTEPGMPRLLWKDGVTSLPDLSEKLKVGIMFTLVVVSLQEEGSKWFSLGLGSSQRINEMCQVFQMLLLYRVWLKQDSYWKRGNKDAKESARTAIHVMLRELICLWPCVRGQGWEKAKIHEQRHVPDDIERNGAPQGSHMGRTEHNHIRLFKQPAKGTPQRADVFDRQLGQQVSDSYIVDMAYQRMSSKYGKTLQETLSSLGQSTGLSSQGAKGWLFVNTHDDQISDHLPATPCFDLLYRKKRTFQRRDDTFSGKSLCSHARIRESSDRYC
jgi:hypothetical protein